MKPQKAYILRISTDLSREYAEIAAESCRKLGIPYEFFEGIENKTSYEAWTQSRLNVKMLGVYKTNNVDKAACATVSHALLWKKILDNRETAIILEHDAVMLQPVDIDIPDERIVVLGYKLSDISRYDHNKAGSPKELITITGHEGAHAYAINWTTAAMMLNELQTIGVSFPIDNTFFLKMRRSKVPLSIASPTPAIAWLRKSTIWNESAEVNYEFIPSFSSHLK